MELTKVEKNAINTLKRLAKRWPESLWLFSGSGTLCVMKKSAEGEHVREDNGAVSQDYIVGTIDIENDGGDW